MVGHESQVKKLQAETEHRINQAGLEGKWSHGYRSMSGPGTGNPSGSRTLMFY